MRYRQRNEVNSRRCRNPVESRLPLFPFGRQCDSTLQYLATRKESMKKQIALLAVSAMSLLVVMGINASRADAGQAACSKYHGRNYIICSESGPRRMPHGLRPGSPHPGASSASGPCGFLQATRMQYGGDSLGACERYMRSRYGSWSAAERKHRRSNWW